MTVLRSFDLKVWGSEAAGYTVEAVGPGGERVSAPFDRPSLAALAPALEATRANMAARQVLEQVGGALFRALFPMDLMMVYVAAKSQLEEGEGLRLRLHLPPELAELPWELLYYPPFYLSTDPRSPVVRFLDLPDVPRPLALRPPLRLLHLVAGPVDAPPLDMEREAAQLHAALADLTARGIIDVVPAQPATLAALHDGLGQGGHILHFSGHGGFAEGVGYLLFEDDDRRSQPVSGDTLAHLLRGTSVRLAFLNACESGRAVDNNAFGSVAAVLVRAGLPAVIAHQYPLPDSSAIPFAAEFYRALAGGFPVDGAVSEGRKAILSELGEVWRDRVDWAAPVLFMNAPDGRILVLEQEEGAAEAIPGQPLPATIRQEVIALDDAATIGTVSGGTVNVDFGGPPDAMAKPSMVDRLPGLLDELKQTVREHAPKAKRDQALEKVAALQGAATGACPDLAVMEAVLAWFESELPSLAGAVLSAILGIESRAREAGDEVWMEFRRRFGGND